MTDEQEWQALRNHAMFEPNMNAHGYVVIPELVAEVERLRAIVTSQDRQLASYDAQVTEQAKWIERLRAELAAVRVEIDKLTADASPLQKSFGYKPGAFKNMQDTMLYWYGEAMRLRDGAE